jgi:hypothetical protein
MFCRTKFVTWFAAAGKLDMSGERESVSTASVARALHLVGRRRWNLCEWPTKRGQPETASETPPTVEAPHVQPAAVNAEPPIPDVDVKAEPPAPEVEMKVDPPADKEMGSTSETALEVTTRGTGPAGDKIPRIYQMEVGSFVHPNKNLEGAHEWVFEFMDPMTPFRDICNKPASFVREFAYQVRTWSWEVINNLLQFPHHFNSLR